MRKEVPIGVVYGEEIVVPVGNGKELGLTDRVDEHLSNPRTEFLKKHNDPKKYAFFTDKPDIEYKFFKKGYPSYDNKKRLHNYAGSDNEGRHYFGDIFLSDTDPIYCKEIIEPPLSDDNRCTFFSNIDIERSNLEFFTEKRKLGKFIEMIPSFGVRNYYFRDVETGRNKSDGEEKIFYEDSVSGGRRKQRTNRRKNKNRRTKSRRNRRS